MEGLAPEPKGLTVTDLTDEVDKGLKADLASGNTNPTDRPMDPSIHSAVTSLGDDPDKMARVMELSRTTGLNPDMIAGDLDGFSDKLRHATASGIVEDNPYISGYLAANKFHARISNDDYANLDEATAAIKGIRQTSATDAFIHRAERSVAPAAGSVAAMGTGFAYGSAIGTALLPGVGTIAGGVVGAMATGIGTAYGISLLQDYLVSKLPPDVLRGTGFDPEQAALDAQQHPTAAFLGEMAPYIATMKPTGTLAARAFGAVTGGGFEAATELAHEGKIDWEKVAYATGLGGVFADPNRIGNRLMDLGRKATPFLNAGHEPPVGADPLIDAGKVEQNKQGVERLSEALKAVMKSKTRERSPEAMRVFTEQFPDAEVAISGNKAVELYGDRTPTPDDGILGWVPGIEAKLQAARDTGADVTIPQADWLAKVDPKVASEVMDDLRVHPEGITANEAKERPVDLTKEPLDAPEAPKTSEEIQAIRDLIEETAEPKAPVEGEVLPPDQTQVAVDVLRESAALRPAKALGDRERQITALKLKKEDTAQQPTGDTAHTFSLTDEAGKDAGYVFLNERDGGKVLYVEQIAGNRGPQGFGSKLILSVLEQLKKEFPKAERVEGVRVSGAREKSGAMGPASVRLDDLGSLPADATFDFGFGSAKQEARPFTSEGETVQPLYSHKLEDLLTELPKPTKGIAGQIAKLWTPKLVKALEGVEVSVMRQADVDRLMADVTGGKENVPGFYDPNTHRIILSDTLANGGWGSNLRTATVVHEAVHAYTEHMLLIDKAFEAQITGIMHEVEEYLRKAAPKDLAEYGFSNPSEFVAEAFSNPRFQELLASIPVSKELAKHLGVERGVIQNLWDYFAATIRGIMRRELGVNVEHSAMDAMLKLGERFEEQSGRYRQAREKVGLRGAEALGEPTEGHVPPFESGRATGLTKEQYERWQKRVEETQNEDREARFERAKAEHKERTSEEWKQALIEERPEALKAVNSIPHVMADNFFRDGVLSGEQMSPAPKLRIDSLTPEQRQAIPKKMQGKVGLDPEEAAGIFGYRSGKEMMDGLIGYQKQIKESGTRADTYKRRLVAAEAEQRVRQRLGNPADEVLTAAKDQVLSESEVRWLHEETQHMAEEAGQQFPLKQEFIAGEVNERFGKLTASEVSSNKFLASAGRAGRAVMDALLKKDFVKGFQEQQRQYISALYGRQALALEKARKDFDKTVKRYSKPVHKAIDQATMDYVHYMMDKAGIKVKRSSEDIQAGVDHHGHGSLGDYVKQLAGDGWTPEVANNIAAGDIKPLERMTVDEFKDFKDAIDSMLYIGRQMKRIDVAGHSLDYAEFKSGVLARITSLPRRAKWTRGLFHGDAVLARMENVVKDLDLREDFGPLYEALINPFEIAKADSFELMTQLKQRLETARKGQFGTAWMKTLNDSIPQKLLWDPSTEAYFTLTRRNLIGIMLNWGNLSNIEKFARTWGGASEGRVLSREEGRAFAQKVKALIDQHATKDDWDFAQFIWDTFKGWQPRADQVYRRTSGKAPKWIKAEPVQTPHGVYDGGYFPVMYDRTRSNIGIIEEKSAGLGGIFGPDYFRATTAKGHTNERTGYQDFIDIETTFDTLGLRMQQMIHDISFREFVMQANKIVHDKQIRAAINKHYGAEYGDQLDPWLRRIANNFNVDEKGLQAVSQLLRLGRGNLILAALPFNPKVMFTPDVGAVTPARMVRFYANRADNVKLAMEKSKEIPYLVYNMDRDFREQLEQITIKNGWKRFQQKAAEIGYTPAVKMSQEFRMMTFVDEYRKAIRSGMNENEAVSIADSYVREQHGSAHIGDLPSIMASNEGMKIFTMFYGYFNTMYNWQRRIPGDLRRGDYRRAMQAAYGVFGLSAAINAMVEPRHKDESWPHFLARAFSMNTLALVPFVRDIAGLAFEGYEPKSPLFGVTKAWWQLGKDGKKFMVEKRPPEKMLSHGIRAVGTTFGVPGSVQGAKTGQFFRDVSVGAQRPRDFPEWVRGVLYGEAQPRR